MARKPRTPEEDAGVESVEKRVTKMCPKKTLNDWLKAKDEARASIGDINTSMAEHTKNAIKKGMNKRAGQMLDQLQRLTPEQLADWEEHFFDGYEKSGLKARAASAPRFEMGEDDDREGEDEDDSDSGKSGNGANVAKFPQAQAAE